MVLSYDYSNRNRWRRRTNAPLSLAISIAMAVRWCDTACIARWRRSRALIEATKRHHRATTRSVLPRWPPVLSIDTTTIRRSAEAGGRGDVMRCDRDGTRGVDSLWSRTKMAPIKKLRDGRSTCLRWPPFDRET